MAKLSLVTFPRGPEVTDTVSGNAENAVTKIMPPNVAAPFIARFNQQTVSLQSCGVLVPENAQLPPLFTGHHVQVAVAVQVQQLDPVERAILRIAVYELLERIDIPYRVVINEAVQLAKKFGAEQGHAFVNGVLDRAASKLRSSEYRKAGGQAG